MSSWLTLAVTISGGVVMLLRWWLSEAQKHKRKMKRERKYFKEMGESVSRGDSDAIANSLDDIGL